MVSIAQILAQSRADSLNQGLAAASAALLAPPTVGAPNPRGGLGNALNAFSQQVASGRNNALQQALALRQLQLQEAGLEQRADIADKNRAAQLEVARIRAGKGTVRDKKIANLVAQGVPRERAANLVDGIERVEINSVLGTAQAINEANGTVTEIPVQVAKKIVANEGDGRGTPPTNKQTEQRFAVNQAFGAGAVMKRLSDKTLGQIFDTFQFPSARVADSFAKGIKSDIVRSLSISGRPPVVEQERIIAALPSDGLFENPESAKAILNTTVRRLETQRKADIEFAENPKNAPVERRKAQAQAKALERTISLIKQFDGVDGKEAVKRDSDLPEGIPSGSRLLGVTRSGERIFESPDGKRFGVK